MRRARFNGWALLYAALGGAAAVIGYLTLLRGNLLGAAGIALSLLLCAGFVILDGAER